MKERKNFKNQSSFLNCTQTGFSHFEFTYQKVVEIFIIELLQIWIVGLSQNLVIDFIEWIFRKYTELIGCSFIPHSTVYAAAAGTRQPFVKNGERFTVTPASRRYGRTAVAVGLLSCLHSANSLC